MAHLVWVKGGQRRGSEVVHLPARGITLGRDAVCDCCLEDDAVSRCHAKISPTQEGWEFRDLRSRNGSFLNHTRTERALLRHGDHLRMGRIVFRFEDPQPTSLHALPDPETQPSAAKGRLPLAALLTLLLAAAAGAGWWLGRPRPKATISAPRSLPSAERGPDARSAAPVPQPEASSPLTSPETKPETPPPSPQDSRAAASAPAAWRITIFAQVGARFAPPFQGGDQEWPAEQELHLELEGLPIQGSQGLCHGTRKVPGATDEIAFNQEGGRITNLRWIATRMVARTFEDGREEPMREERWELEVARLDRQTSAKSEMYLWRPAIGPEPRLTHAVRFFPGNTTSDLVQASWSRTGKGSLEASVQINRLR